MCNQFAENFKTSLKHRRKNVLRSLQLYGDQAFSNRTIIHQFSQTLVNSKVYPRELSSVQELTSSVLKHNTEVDNHLQMVQYTL